MPRALARVSSPAYEEARPCPTCQVEPGGPHESTCSTAHCPDCGELPDDEHSCRSNRPAIWHGVTPEVLAAQALEGFTADPVTKTEVEDHPHVHTAIAFGYLVWDPASQRFQVTDPVTTANIPPMELW